MVYDTSHAKPGDFAIVWRWLEWCRAHPDEDFITIPRHDYRSLHRTMEVMSSCTPDNLIRHFFMGREIIVRE